MDKQSLVINGGFEKLMQNVGCGKSTQRPQDSSHEQKDNLFHQTFWSILTYTKKHTESLLQLPRGQEEEDTDNN